MKKFKVGRKLKNIRKRNLKLIRKKFGEGAYNTALSIVAKDNEIAEREFMNAK